MMSLLDFADFKGGQSDHANCVRPPLRRAPPAANFAAHPDRSEPIVEEHIVDPGPEIVGLHGCSRNIHRCR